MGDFNLYSLIKQELLMPDQIKVERIATIDGFESIIKYENLESIDNVPIYDDIAMAGLERRVNKAAKELRGIANAVGCLESTGNAETDLQAVRNLLGPMEQCVHTAEDVVAALKHREGNLERQVAQQQQAPQLQLRVHQLQQQIQQQQQAFQQQQQAFQQQQQAFQQQQQQIQQLQQQLQQQQEQQRPQQQQQLYPQQRQQQQQPQWEFNFDYGQHQ